MEPSSKKPPSRPTQRRFGRLTPQWLQGMAAILAAVVGLGTLVNQWGEGGKTPAATTSTLAGPATTSTTSSAAPRSEPSRAVLESVLVGPDDVRASGSFRDVDLDIEAVLLIGQPASDPTAEWAPVIAETSPTSTNADGLATGRWSAMRPTTGSAPYLWYAVIAPTSGGATDSYADLRERGPESELVKALSEPFVTGQ